MLVLSSVLVGGALAADPAEVFQRSGCVGEQLISNEYTLSLLMLELCQATDVRHSLAVNNVQRLYLVGCHAGGGNVVQAGASLQTRDLEKNSAATVDAIYKLIYSGKGKMPGYGKDCQPRVIRVQCNIGYHGYGTCCM